MFGWEFPPHISGGLGTACFGLTKGLIQHDVDVLFVVPRLFGDEDKSKFRFINASSLLPCFKYKHPMLLYWDDIFFSSFNSSYIFKAAKYCFIASG